MEYVLRSARGFVIASILAVIVGITLAVTLAAQRRGMCGDGNFRPPCVMFAFGLNIYAMIGVSAITTLATLITYVVRRRPPVLLRRASILTIATAGALVLAVLAPKNTLAGILLVIKHASRYFTGHNDCASHDGVARRCLSVRSALAWGSDWRLDRGAVC
jgi:hypothetical protein